MEKANTVLINPRWDFKAHSGITNMKSIPQWSDKEINSIWSELEGMIEKDASIFLMVSPTKLATGGHLRATEGWGKYQPRTVHSWRVTNPRGSGRSVYDDNEYYCVLFRTPSRYYKKDSKQIEPRGKDLDQKELLTSSWEAPMMGFGASYGPEVYEHIENIGYGPFLQVFGRNMSDKYIPDHWNQWIPDKEKLNYSDLVDMGNFNLKI